MGITPVAFVTQVLQDSGVPVMRVFYNEIFSGVTRVDYDPSVTQQQIDLANSIINSFDFSQAAIDAYELKLNKQAAKDALTTVHDPSVIGLRNAFRVVMQSLIETRSKVNQLVNDYNTRFGTSFTTLTNRNFNQVLAAARQFIDAENDPNN